ncbi:GTP-binding protein EngB [Candidatus Thorarchaeota archaeon]|jgi:GTP-binding protein EngB required for normal cell division|nr:MAG: GTP-binding protein EngB [Candidatus Thorarchaeota archaeon]
MNEQDPTGKRKPLIVFAGRSNVGKSSTIRALTGVKVRVGKRPGSTRWEQMIDLDPVTIVDIPGFGFMSGQSKATIEETKNHIIESLESWRSRILLTVLIIDISLFRVLFERWSSRGELPVDVEFYSFLCEISPRVIVLANKVDKVKNRHIDDEFEFLYNQLREAVSEREPTIILSNALKKQGLTELRDLIDGILSEEGLEKPRWALI